MDVGRTNQEIYELFNEPIIRNSKNTKLGHLKRMDSVRTVKTMAWRVPEGTKKEDYRENGEGRD